MIRYTCDNCGERACDSDEPAAVCESCGHPGYVEMGSLEDPDDPGSWEAREGGDVPAWVSDEQTCTQCVPCLQTLLNHAYDSRDQWMARAQAVVVAIEEIKKARSDDEDT